MMRARIALLVLLTLACLYYAQACDQEDIQNGCKISGSVCTCGYGCKSEYIYRTRLSCLNALRDKNICYRMPCVRGTCIQTAQDPGFICKCDGTGYYGQRCEKACPLTLVRGLVFPYECIVI